MLKYYIIYLVIFRLSIILAALVCIILGSKLFQNGYSDIKNNTSFTTDITKGKLILKGAAPGTFFALFGVMLIIYSIVTAPPEFSFDSYQEIMQEKDGVRTTTYNIGGGVLRSSEMDILDAILSRYNDMDITSDEAIEQIYEALEE